MKTSNYNFIVYVLLIGLIFLILSCKKEMEDHPTTFKDIDGNVYSTIRIGELIWSGENLKTTKYRNGDPILFISDHNEWFNNLNPAACIYNNDTLLGNKFGYLYNSASVLDIRNIAPKGYRVATDSDWQNLINFLGGFNVAGGKLKSLSDSSWNLPNVGANNESGFSCLPGGYRDANAVFQGFGNFGTFWTSTEKIYGSVYYYSLYNNSILVGREATNLGQSRSALSIRLVKE